MKGTVFEMKMVIALILTLALLAPTLVSCGAKNSEAHDAIGGINNSLNAPL